MTWNCAWQHSSLSPVYFCWIGVLWVSGAAGDWEEELNQASFVDQLALAELCHSKLGPLHPEPGEVLTCKWGTESSKALRLLTKMLQGPTTVPLDVLMGGRGWVNTTLQTEVCLTVWTYVNDWASVWTPKSLHPNRIIYGWYGQSLCG